MTNNSSVTCKHCKKELPPDHKGPCPHCGKTGKHFERTLSTAIGLESFMRYELNERLIKGAKKGSGSRYLEQFDRVKRLYAQFKLINQGIPLPRSLDFDKDKVYQPYRLFFDALEHLVRIEAWWLAICQDQVYAFFQNCWHLKDWIKNDRSGGVYKELRDSIHSDRDMQLCRDICIGTKHLVLKKLPLVGRKTTVAVGGGTTIIKVEYTIDTSSGRTVDAFELATKCLEFWEKNLSGRRC